MDRDKKVLDGNIRLILLKSIGHAYLESTETNLCLINYLDFIIQSINNSRFVHGQISRLKYVQVTLIVYSDVETPLHIMLDREINRSLSQNIKHFVKQGKIMGSKGWSTRTISPNYERNGVVLGSATLLEG